MEKFKLKKVADDIQSEKRKRDKPVNILETLTDTIIEKLSEVVVAETQEHAESHRKEINIRFEKKEKNLKYDSEKISAENKEIDEKINTIAADISKKVAEIGKTISQITEQNKKDADAMRDLLKGETAKHTLARTNIEKSVGDSISSFGKVQRERLSQSEKRIMEDSDKNFTGKLSELEKKIIARHDQMVNTFNKQTEDLELFVRKSTKDILEFGSNFGVSVNGAFVGYLNGMNLINGTNTTVKQSVAGGIITVEIDSSGGSGGSGTWYQDETPSGLVNGSNKVFTLVHSGASAVFVSINGSDQYSGGQDYNLSDSNQTITLLTAPISGDIVRVTYVITTSTWYQDEKPSGTQNGSNKDFSLAHTPTSVTFLSINGEEQYSGGQDYTLSGTSITFVTAPLSTDIIRATYS